MKDVHSLADLRDWTAATAGAEFPHRLAVIGDPVAHSASPRMQNAALAHAQLGLAYTRVQLRPDEFVEGIGLMQAAGFLGANVTIPHKLAAVALCDEMSEGARALGAVNTLSFEGGRIRGSNTDGPGFVRAVREAFGVDLHDLRVLIIGAGGGAGRTLAAQCALSKCERLALINRDTPKAAALARELAPHFAGETRLQGPTARLVSAPFSSTGIEAELAHSDLVVNCTPLGLKFSDDFPLPPRLLQAHLLVFDSVYLPEPQPTRLVQAAREAGARATDGRALLLHQGALAFELWFNRPAPLEVMRAALS